MWSTWSCGILRIAAVVVAILIIVRCLLSLFREKPGKEIWGWLAMNDGTRLELCHWENTVGRGRWADVDLNFPTVSRSHIALLRDGTGRYNPCKPRTAPASTASPCATLSPSTPGILWS